LIGGPTDNANWILGCAAFVDYEGKELTSSTAARQWMFMYGGRGWNGKSQKNGGEVVVEWELCQCPKHHCITIIIIITTSIVSIATIITTIATSITAAEPWHFLRMVSAESVLLGNLN
jgi:hypothetical protein